MFFVRKQCIDATSAYFYGLGHCALNRFGDLLLFVCYHKSDC